ncbi:hypothetical protein FDUTEX481_05672 [Tolypothrix sp. PCC 7601]|nr:hypothetical protein FDUTEX481_05672 [Tolypothrix sp. PCC 7601]
MPSSPKGFSRNKLFHLVGRASCPPHKLGGQDVHPTINTGIFFYLEVPNPFSPRRRRTKSLAPFSLRERGWG